MSGAQVANAAIPAASPGAGPIQPGTGGVRAAIARASQATGIDFDYLLAQARLESSLDPNAKAATSSAAGLYQFTRGTWLQTLDRHGEAHGFGWAGDAIAGGRITDPAQAGKIWSLRFDADASALMAAELARDNRAQLATALGREPDAAELYLGHFLGIGGAGEMLTALRQNPDQSAAALMPRAAAANRAMFHDRGGAPRSVAGLMDHIRGKVFAAMGAEGAIPPASESGAAWAVTDPSALSPRQAYANSPVVRQFALARAQLPPSAQSSMADTLLNTFGGAGSADASSAPEFVRAAYDKLSRFGL